MKVLKVLTIVFITLAILAGTAFFLVGYLKPKPGGLMVTAVNPTDVYVNNVFVGKTPYSGVHEPGQIALRVGAFETGLNIVSGIQTVVKPGGILTFEKVVGDSAPIRVVSDPENAQILIDGTSRGFAPYETESLLAAQHILTIRAPGFVDRTEKIRNVVGYKLLVFVQLEKEPVKEPEKVEPPKVYIEILNTPNDFLRIREMADTTSKELGRAKTGEILLVLDDSNKDWYKVEKQLEDGTKIEGYVSSAFVKIATPTSSPIPSQIPTTEAPE